MIDPLLYDTYIYLPVEDILNLSLVSKEFHSVLSKKGTWNTLIGRDFNQKGEKEDYKIKWMVNKWKKEIEKGTDKSLLQLADIARYGLEIEEFEGIPLIDRKIKNDGTDAALFKKRLFYLIQSLEKRKQAKVRHTYEIKLIFMNLKYYDVYELKSLLPFDESDIILRNL